MERVEKKDAGIQKKKTSWLSWKKSLWAYLLMLPALLYFLINNYIPMYGITIAFRKLDYRLGVFKSPFNGLENFRFLFANNDIWVALRNTVLYNLAFIILGTIFALTVAILFNEITHKLAKSFFQTSILLPNLMSMVIVSYLVFAFLSADNGFINKSIIEPMTGNFVNFYQEKAYWPFILFFVYNWKGIGFSMVLYYSSILGVSQDLYESARLDGASKWQQILHITLPQIKPTIITMFILSISKICASDFGLFYQVPKNSGTLYPVTRTVDTFVYNALMNQNNIALSSAASVFQAIVGFVLVLLANLVIRKVSREDALF